MIREVECAAFLQWALPRLRLRWAGFRKVRRQVCKRLRRRIHDLSLETLEQYRGQLQADPHEWAVLDHLCRITISRLYRDKWVFDFLGGVILPELAKRALLQSRPIRCWCVGCASGEEVYTLKILWDLEVQLKARPAEIEVIGTDVDEVVLRRAERACFSFGSVKDAPAHWLGVAFEQCDQDYCVRPTHWDGVTFKRQDIRSELPAGCFDLVLCRNIIFTYFEIELQRAIFDRLATVLHWLRVGEQRYFERATASPTAMSKPQAHRQLNSGSRHLTKPSGRGRSRSAVKAVRPASSLHGVDRQRRAKSASTSAPPAI